MPTAEELLARHGRSDRTPLALLATSRPAGRHLARFLQRGEVGVVGSLALGLRFPARALPPSHAQTRQLLRGELEIPVQEALRRSLPAGGTLWDVGANVGFFSLLGARLVGPAGHVVAWEPVAEWPRSSRRPPCAPGSRSRSAPRPSPPGRGASASS